MFLSPSILWTSIKVTKNPCWKYPGSLGLCSCLPSIDKEIAFEMRMKKENKSKTDTQKDMCACLLIRYLFYTLETMQFWILFDWRNNLGAMKRRYDSQVIMIEKCYLLKYIHHLTIINECQVGPQFWLTIWQPDTFLSCQILPFLSVLSLSYQPKALPISSFHLCLGEWFYSPFKHLCLEK